MGEYLEEYYGSYSLPPQHNPYDDYWYNNSDQYQEQNSSYVDSNCYYSPSNDGYFDNNCYFEKDQVYSSLPQPDGYFNQYQEHDHSYFENNGCYSPSNDDYFDNNGYQNYPSLQQQHNPPDHPSSSEMSLEDIVKNLATSSQSFQRETISSFKNLEQQLSLLVSSVSEINSQVEEEEEEEVEEEIVVKETTLALKQSSDNLLDTTRESEINFFYNDEYVLYNDESSDNIIHEPTPPNSEVEVEDYVSSDEEDFESDIIEQEKSDLMKKHLK